LVAINARTGVWVSFRLSQQSTGALSGPTHTYTGKHEFPADVDEDALAHVDDDASAILQGRQVI